MKKMLKVETFVLCILRTLSATKQELMFSMVKTLTVYCKILGSNPAFVIYLLQNNNDDDDEIEIICYMKHGENLKE